MAGMTGTERIIADLKRLEPRLRTEGVAHPAVFNSRARGDNRADSDPDVLMDVAKGSSFSLLSLVGVGHLIQGKPGIEISAAMSGDLKGRFFDETSPDDRPVF